MNGEQTKTVDKQVAVTGSTVLSFTKPTPTWANWCFRVVFILTGVATFIIAADPAIADDTKIRLGVYLKGLDMAIWGITRAIGIDVSREFPNAKV